MIRKITGNKDMVTPYRKFAILCRKCHDKVEKIYQQKDKDLELFGSYIQTTQQCDESLFMIYVFIIQYYNIIYNDFIQNYKKLK